MNQDDPPFSVVTLAEALCGAIDTAAASFELEPRCDSPIEVQLGAHLLLSLPVRFQIVPQFPFLRFLIDFAIVRVHSGQPVLFIECDGKEFHSSPQQIAADRRKDAAAAHAGIKLLRFTGSEIFRHPHECSAQVIRALEDF